MFSNHLHSPFNSIPYCSDPTDWKADGGPRGPQQQYWGETLSGKEISAAILGLFIDAFLIWKTPNVFDRHVYRGDMSTKVMCLQESCGFQMSSLRPGGYLYSSKEEK